MAGRWSCGPALAVAIGLSFWMVPGLAAGIDVYSPDDLNAAIGRTMPGDVITLAPGSYQFDSRIAVSANGTTERPIILRAAIAGTVELRARAQELFKVSGANWIFENLDIAGVCTADNDCEHAFHIVAAADHTVIRHNRIRDFNAHIKGNGENQRWPQQVIIEDNSLFATHHRATDNPVAFIDVVGGQGWVVRRNLIADFGKKIDHAAVKEDDWSYALFLKGNSSAGLIERNIVDCALSLPAVPAARGISLGGSSTGKQFCDGNCDEDEHRDGIIRNNVVLNCPTDAGIFLNRAIRTRVLNNTLFDTTGIWARFKDSTAIVSGNIVAGAIQASDGAQVETAYNFVAGGGDRGVEALDRLFVNPKGGQLALKPGMHVETMPPTPEVPDDLCGTRRPAQGNTAGAILYGGAACRFAEETISAHRAYLAALRARASHPMEPPKPPPYAAPAAGGLPQIRRGADGKIEVVPPASP